MLENTSGDLSKGQKKVGTYRRFSCDPRTIVFVMNLSRIWILLQIITKHLIKVLLEMQKSLSWFLTCLAILQSLQPN